MSGKMGLGVVQFGTFLAGVFRRRAFGLGISWAPIACILQTACGGIAIEPPPDPEPIADDAAAVPDVVEKPAVDASPDVEDAATGLVCDFPTGVIECGDGGFYCIVPASGHHVSCVPDGDEACAPGFACAPDFFDAALGHVK